MDQPTCKAIRIHTGTKVSGNNVPNPVCSFAHFNFDESLMNNIRKAQFAKPTGIQCQAVPCILSGRDMLGIAKTGSGKTAAFIWPCIVHILNQDPVDKGEGAIGIMCSPTRELSWQIFKEVEKFTRGTKLRVCPLFGGMTMYEQKRALEKGVEIIVCTPGRMIDMIKKQHTNCFRSTYLVLDEAD
eukprot:UN31277